MDWIKHLELIIGAGGVNRLRDARIIVFGMGGVGSYAVEALVRAGIGHIDIVDCNTVSVDSINRQLTSYHSVVGRPKADVCREHISSINPNCEVCSYEIFVTPDNIREFPITECDYAVDTIDNIEIKVALAKACEELGVPLISDMGAKNKLNPTLFKIADIYETSVCPVAGIMREELKKAGVKSLKAIYSTEKPVKPPGEEAGTISYIPGIIGMLIAGEIIKEMLAQVGIASFVESVGE